MAKVAFDLYSLALGSATVIDDLVSQMVQEGYVISEEPGGGQVDVEHQGVLSGEPVFEFVTKQLASALGAMGTSGGLARLSQSIAALTGGVELNWQARANAGIHASGSAHLSTTCAAGMLVLQQLVAERNRDAEATFRGVGLSSDGLTHPFVEASSQALPTKGPVDERFCLGDVTVEEVVLDNVTGITLRPNIELEVLRTNSDVFPTLISIKSRKPVLELRGYELNAAMDRVVATQAETLISLRKRDSTGAGNYVSDDTSAHITLTCAGLVTRPERRAQGIETAECTYELRVKNDLTNALIAWNLAAALA